MSTVLYSLCECIRQIAILTQPILPDASAKISAMLGQEKNDFSMLGVALKPGLKIDEPQPLFAKYS
jgi:methionyl-tRNA synthetase